jgi:hypothetical protein
VRRLQLLRPEREREQAALRRVTLTEPEEYVGRKAVEERD